MAKLKRPHMPLSVKLEAALLALGMDPKKVQWDHFPALGLRPFDEEKGDYDPPANDPRYIVPRMQEDHAAKTFGSHVPLSGDVQKIAKTKRISKAHEEFRSRLLTKPTKEERPKSKWPKRPFRRK